MLKKYTINKKCLLILEGVKEVVYINNFPIGDRVSICTLNYFGLYDFPEFVDKADLYELDHESETKNVI